MTTEEMGEKIATHEQQIISLEHRVKDLEGVMKTQTDLVISVNKLALNMENMLTEQREQGNRLKKLEQEPAERWTSAKRSAFTTIVSVIAGALAVGILQLIMQNL